MTAITICSDFGANWIPGTALSPWLVSLFNPTQDGYMVISILKMRKLRPEEVKWASITQTFDQPLFLLLWKPEVRKQVLFPDHEITVGQISSDFWCLKMVNSNTDRPVHNDTKHSCLSPWVSSQLLIPPSHHGQDSCKITNHRSSPGVVKAKRSFPIRQVHARTLSSSWDIC